MSTSPDLALMQNQPCRCGKPFNTCIATSCEYAEPYPDLRQPQVEAESVDTDEFRTLLANCAMHEGKHVNALIAHIDSIITPVRQERDLALSAAKHEAENSDMWRERALAASQAAPAKAEGWISAPTKPTEEMLAAGARSIIDGQESRPGTSWADEAGLAYEAMLNAAPSTPLGEQT